MSRLATVLAVVSVLAAATGTGLLVGQPGSDSPEIRTDESVGDPYASLHEAGLTGENVSVGIVEPTGFEPDAAAAESVVAARAFGDGKTLTNGGANDHGRAVVATVSTIAPDAELYLAAFGDERDFRDAAGWLADQNVDVVVLPTSFYGKSGDGTARSTQVVSRLARDAVVIAAAGNGGDGHWRGAYDPRNGSETRLEHPETGEPVRLEVSGERTQVWLGWSSLDEQYRLRIERNGTTVATSDPYPDDVVPNERIDASLADGSYELYVEGGENATGTRLRVESPTDRLTPADPTGSIVAPATARGVVAVGAYDTRRDRVPAYSSRGPTADGRNGLDVVASESPPRPTGRDATGTSYAAARIGGVTALLLSADGDLSSTEVERVLEATARDVGPPGRDDASGHGLVRPVRAVEYVLQSESD